MKNPDVTATPQETYMENRSTNKYTLFNIGEIDNPDAFKKHMQKRIDTFENQAITFKELYFRGITDEEIKENEKGKKPPIVVVSSGRAQWIAEAFEIGDNTVNNQGDNFIKDITNTSIFRNGAVPLYFPKRYPDKERNFYIFVHQTEYEMYSTKLNTYGIKVIGWNTTNQLPSVDKCLGFGMSRFVVFQFFKDLFKNFPKHFECKKIWMIDDNVCHILGKNFSLSKTEENSDNFSGMGFSAKNTQMSNYQFIKLYEKSNNKANNPKELLNFKKKPLKFIQQAVLWNFKNIHPELSFSPYFIGSNEDITFCQALLNNPIQKGKINYNSEATILKCQVYQDPNQDGLAAYKALKDGTFEMLANGSPCLNIRKDELDNPKDLFTYIQNGFNDFNFNHIKQQEKVQTTFIKACELITRESMRAETKNVFNRVPKDCFIFQGEFKITRNK